MANCNPSPSRQRKPRRAGPESDSGTCSGRLSAVSLQSFQPPASGTVSIGRSAMKPVTVVLAVPDPTVNDMLLNSLRAHFRVVLPAGNPEQIRPAIVKHRADVLLMDLESFSLDESRACVRLSHRWRWCVFIAWPT